MNPRRHAALVLAVGALIGCDAAAGGSAGITEPGEPLLARGRVVNSATGSGHFSANAGGFPDQSGDWRTFSFTAVKGDGGATTGMFQLVNRTSGIRTRGKVTCLTVIGNEAWIGGVITRSTNSAFVGQAFFFHAKDNGEGQNAPADQISPVALTTAAGYPDTFCSSTPASFFYASVEAGNIQVR